LSGILPPLRKGSVERRARIRKLEGLIKTMGPTDDLDKILAKFAYEEGISIRCAKEYVDLLKKAGVI
jgi:hypothetical protein